MKIAILGGGVGAMTAAYWLTNRLPDGTLPDHDITVYQLGWRLGGKGASGRDVDEGYRIQEHGLHIWMGTYANAFRMMRTVYDELQRPPGTPLATWRDAFKPQGAITLMEERGHEWLKNEWVFPYPFVAGSPGDQTSFPPPCGYLPSLVHSAAFRVDRFLNGFEHDACVAHELPDTPRGHLHTLHGALREAAALAGTPHQPGTRGDDPSHHHLALKLLLEGAQKMVGIGFDLSGDCIGMQRSLCIVDLMLAVLLGIIRDLCGTDDWTVIDDQEWRSWLRGNGLHEITEHCPVIRAGYDLVFAFREGRARDWDAMDLAAGTATSFALRVSFDYYEAVFMRMQASMGETIFTPIYEALQKRGVKFRFFHRLREVIPSDDGSRIQKLRIGVQATTKSGSEYNPLFTFKGVGCWPSKPFFDQLQQGEELKARGIDLEDYNAPWPDVEELVLEEGKDFDLVVFGLSLGAVPIVCPRLLEQKPPWKAMVDHVGLVETLAYQFWFLRNVADLGWPPALNGRNFGEYGVLSTFAEPADTWADMSHLLPLEGWNVPVQNASYFCGPVRTGSTLDDVRDIAWNYLKEDAPSLWTMCNDRNGRFRYEWLAVNDPRPDLSDRDRFLRQYFRINDQPTEKYVMSLSGSTKYRLDPANTGYANLVLAGDWVKNGLAIGCVESAVLGGMKGVQPYCPGMVIVE